MTPVPQPLDRMKGTAMMVFGLPGSGKTTLIGTGDRTLIVRPPTDHTDSIRDQTGVEELVITGWSDMFEIFSWLQQGAHAEYDWVWLDSVSLAQDVLLEDVMDDALARRPDRGMDKGGVIVPEFGPDQGEFKVNFERLNKWTRDMVGLAKAGHLNFGMTAHPFEWIDPTQNKELWAPWIQGKSMSPELQGHMNIVAVLQEARTDNGIQRILMVDAPGHVGKDQFDVFPALKSGRHGFVNPTMADIDQAISQKSGGAQPPRRRRKTAGKPRKRSRA